MITLTPEKTLTLEELRAACRAQFDDFDFALNCESCFIRDFCKEFFKKAPAQMILDEPKQKPAFEDCPF